MLKIVLIVIGGILGFWILVVPVLERLVPRRWLVRYWHAVNPVMGKVAGLAPGFGVVETTGRRTGRRHRVPVGGRLQGDTFWFLAGNGYATHYVKNIEADPRVRVKVHGRWREGIANLCPDDNVWKRMLRINPANSIFTAIAGHSPLSVRVDLES